MNPARAFGSAVVSRYIDGHVGIEAVSIVSVTFLYCLLLARLMGHYCFARWRLSFIVVCNVTGRPAVGRRRAGRRTRGRSCGRHCTAGQYGYVPLGQHLVFPEKNNESLNKES